jgi:hypothetical protein
MLEENTHREADRLGGRRQLVQGLDEEIAWRGQAGLRHHPPGLVLVLRRINGF